MDDLLKQLPGLGIGGLLAALIFYWYRQDVERYTVQWKGQSEMLMKVVMENTASNTAMSSLIQSLHAHLISDKKIQDRRDNLNR